MAAVAMLSTFGASSALAADLRIAYVNWSALLAKSKPVRQARARIKKEFGPREKRLKAKIGKFKLLQSRLKKDHRVMSKAQLIKLQRQIRSLQRDIKRDNVEMREDLALRNSEESSKLQRLIKKAIVNLAKREKYDLVMQIGVLYYSKRVDITDKVLAELAK